jgi:hypothetical protein
MTMRWVSMSAVVAALVLTVGGCETDGTSSAGPPPTSTTTPAEDDEAIPYDQETVSSLLYALAHFGEMGARDGGPADPDSCHVDDDDGIEQAFRLWPDDLAEPIVAMQAALQDASRHCRAGEKEQMRAELSTAATWFRCAFGVALDHFPELGVDDTGSTMLTPEERASIGECPKVSE